MSISEKFIVFFFLGFFSILRAQIPCQSRSPEPPHATQKNNSQKIILASAIAKEKITHLYRLMHIIHTTFKKCGLQYWIDGGTLLGAVRHKGIIPHDDDIDLCIWLKDIPKLMGPVRQELAKQGCVVSPCNIYKIRFAHPQFGDTTVFCDVFPQTSTKDGRVIFPGPYFRWIGWDKRYFHYKKNLLPLKKMPFGPTQAMAPHYPQAYLDHAYPGWDKKIVISNLHIPRQHPLFKTLTFPITFPCTPELLVPAEWDTALFQKKLSFEPALMPQYSPFILPRQCKYSFQ